WLALLPAHLLGRGWLADLRQVPSVRGSCVLFLLALQRVGRQTTRRPPVLASRRQRGALAHRLTVQVVALQTSEGVVVERRRRGSFSGPGRSVVEGRGEQRDALGLGQAAEHLITQAMVA